MEEEGRCARCWRVQRSGDNGLSNPFGAGFVYCAVLVECSGVRQRLSSSATAKLAVAGLMGSFLIPITTSTLNGLTHLVSCTAAVDQTFAITAVDSKRAVVIGSSEVVRKPPEGDCAAVELNMVVRPDGKGYVRISMPVSNQSSRGFRATVKLRLGDLRIPVPVGLVHPGEVKTKDLRIRLDSDLKVVNSTLLIGPQ